MDQLSKLQSNRLPIPSTGVWYESSRPRIRMHQGLKEPRILTVLNSIYRLKDTQYHGPGNPVGFAPTAP
ncbi:Protein of unknown function [Pyronema omphalodes CBS 100304]|uniref:Uncharacterized protein n=1 Tax=Pyronema omphalodes (strain CBS 100304) TaxID=1076935 RepID=U4LEU9_PYROM|nr:Protein of unknown function [Pyronema omphalodes CBS 100304]